MTGKQVFIRCLMLWTVLSSSTTLAWAAPPADVLLLPHRWEIEPDLGASWEILPSVNPYVVDAEIFSRSTDQACVDEARRITNAVALDPQGRMESLQAIIARLKSPQENRQFRLALGSAAIRLSQGEEADKLWTLLHDDPQTSRIVERGLIQWKHPAALSEWRQRIASDSLSDPSRLFCALDGLEQLGSQSDQEPLLQWIENPSIAMPVRVAAARTLGMLVDNGLETTARQILEQAQDQSPLIVAHLLASHRGEEGLDLLKRVAGIDHGPAQLLAYESIARNHLSEAREMVEPMLKHPDSGVRRQAVLVLDKFDDVESIQQQAIVFADRNFTVREALRRSFIRKGERPELRELIDEIIGNRLASDSYEDIAQAILLSAFLMERERCPALVALLEHPNPEVNIRAGWALQELADSEEVMASMLPHVERITEKLSTAGTATIDEINRLAYLLEVFGRNRYEPVVELLMLYVPKNDFRMGTVSRTSAIWSLGKIYEGKKNANLAKQLAARLLDDHPIFPEEDLVKYSSALAMGRIGDPSSPDRLLEAGIQGDSPIALACRWAMEQYNKPDTNAQ